MTQFDQTKQDLLANEALSLIELSEVRLLSWGFFNVQSDLRTELPGLLETLPSAGAALWEQAEQVGYTSDSILKNLLERKLLIQSQGLYRSRFAETVRLLYLLRQRFSYSDWLTAPRLVSDLKLHLQRRRYPRRDIELTVLEQDLARLRLTPLHLAAVRALLSASTGTGLALAQFQREAIIQQFRNLRERGDRALVIGAGTGAGKTKAFYIPAMAELAATLTSAHFVRTMALYPRVELLKDQLAEAFSETRKLDGLLRANGRRQLTIGAYYGETPKSAAAFLGPYPPAGWIDRPASGGWVCPFFRCPMPDCREREMLWSKADLQQEHQANARGEYGRFARLRCATCGFEVKGGLLLTREQMLREPPDIFFTTTEMVNRRLSRVREHALFGVGTASPPQLLLLDEIHTYDGITGAQVAYLLRRWRHARGINYSRSLCIVGLSATLTQAEQFFSRLTGIPLHHVSYIQPRAHDMVEEGIEYNVVLKGDPVSGTSLLSTSVQTAMLIGRVLDPLPHHGTSPVSRGAYGHKTFAFTDKLDVINRWYHIEQEAETHKVLSQYRDTSRLTEPERLRRRHVGQDWILASHIGHVLRTPLRLDLTSSQSRGVQAAAELVIATSTLEVGFNDPAVGAVIQHKAPRGLASFLQRKGRAGRTRAMRPWMLVVTSAYGRDRWAFQHAENLFDPLLPPINLPVDNYYVRKIQASYALMDWLARVLGDRDDQVDVWRLLSSSVRAGTIQQRQQIRDILESVLVGIRLPELSTFLRQALDLDEQSVHEVLWSEPRSLLLDVLPTLLRQLETGWQCVRDGEIVPWSDTIAHDPLPDFVPPNLFTDLNLPELTLHIPDGASVPPRRSAASRGRARGTTAPPAEAAAPAMRDDERLALALGMVEYAPGHVSKRYSRGERIKEAHWLELPDDEQLTAGKLPLAALKIERERVPRVVAVDGTEYRVFRPRSYTLGLVPEKVKSTSTGRLEWRSHFALRHEGRTAAAAMDVSSGASTITDGNAASSGQTLAVGTRSARFIRRIQSYTQANGAWAEVTRLAIGVQTETRFTSGTEVKHRLRFEEDGRPAALGFTLDVDALAIELEPLNTIQVFQSSDWPSLYRQLGPEYFAHRLQHDPRLDEAGLSSFDVGWLWQLELSMLVAIAVAEGCDLPTAADRLSMDRRRIADRTMKAIFQSQEIDDDDEISRLHRRLLEYLDLPVVQSGLQGCAQVLWSPDQDGLCRWLEQCYAASLAAALFTTVTRLVPDLDADDLHVDIVGSTVWISEATAGGVGIVSRIADAIAQRPRDLDLELIDVIEHCQREHLALQLSDVARLIDQGHRPLLDAFQAVRTSGDIARQLAIRQQLSAALEQAGVSATRELFVALNAKLLRASSDHDSDHLIADLAQRWRAEEERMGCAIDLRVMAVAARRIPEIEAQVQQVLQRIGGDEALVDETQIFNLLQSLLWLDCHNSCPDCIEHRQPYSELARPSRALLRLLQAPSDAPIDFGAPSWEDTLKQRLEAHYFAQLRCAQAQLNEGKQAILAQLVTPVELGYQLLYPTVERITRVGTSWIIDLAIRELIQA